MSEQNPPETLSIGERLVLVYQRLDALPPAISAEEAFDRLNTILDQVEDEHSGVPKNPNPGLKFDGRMYPPREDFTERTADGRILAATKGNTIEAHPDGTLTVSSRRTGEPVYHRQGAGQAQAVESGPELANQAIAEAFDAVRSAQEALGTSRSHSAVQAEAPAPDLGPLQHGSDRGPEI